MIGRVEVVKKLSLFFIIGCQNSNEDKTNTEEPESKSATKVEMIQEIYFISKVLLLKRFMRMEEKKF